MSPDELPAIFAEGWARPKPHGFLEFFMPRIASDAVFTQPVYGVCTGHEQIAHMFGRLFALLPDLRAEPTHVAVDGEVVFIESRCTATLGRRAHAFVVCDRFVIRDGQISERRSHSDPLPTTLKALRTPTAWPRLVRTPR